MSQDGGVVGKPNRNEYQRKYQRFWRARMMSQLDALSEVMNAVEQGRETRVRCEGRTISVSRSRGRMWVEITGSRPARHKRRFF